MKLRHPIMEAGLAACLCLALILAVPAKPEELSEYGNPLMPVKIKGVTVVAEVVVSPEKLYLGLSHRKGLAPGRGMLFMMPSPEIQQFCMRGMRFAIDIIWIGEGRVIGCETNIAADDPRTLSSPAPVKYVLEVPAGFCDAHRVAAADQVTFIRP